MPGWHISRGIYSINLKLHFLSLQTRQRKSPIRFAQSEERIHICIICFYYPSVKVRMQETEERNKVVLATKSFFYWNCEILDVLTVYWMFHKTKIQFVFMAFSFYETAGSCFLSTYLLVKSQVFFSLHSVFPYLKKYFHVSPGTDLHIVSVTRNTHKWLASSCYILLEQNVLSVADRQMFGSP